MELFDPEIITNSTSLLASSPLSSNQYTPTTTLSNSNPQKYLHFNFTSSLLAYSHKLHYTYLPRFYTLQSHIHECQNEISNTNNASPFLLPGFSFYRFPLRKPHGAFSQETKLHCGCAEQLLNEWMSDFPASGNRQTVIHSRVSEYGYYSSLWIRIDGFPGFPEEIL